ncbi:hypothetical protein AZ34_07195 [Hylemonella gracilis str. Niagara R]|uniref:Uncharacterized protein n=1 Tax=Hylemonella gracilis str. Niagara R TaxID=1458275 RepID=A0A016XFK2_9BURK|nr:hypothetical protein [Hylemonella gracilis]EYC50879.1 hypothetical protein AZ34_07195 [Hylemonella gracilis str. Niagara R]
MAAKTCFVVMAIGEQNTSGGVVSAVELRTKYDDLIKEAILKARPGLDVVRADDVSLPGTITTDIISRIMHSDYVVADVTYPNPNVFYELGLRHACRTGTVIIRDKEGPRVPFDIAHLRYVEYENTTTGLKQLSAQLVTYFDHFDRDPTRPDNHFQEFAKLTNYSFPDYRREDPVEPEMQAFMNILEAPEIMNLILKQQAGDSMDEAEIFRAVIANPKVAQPLVQALYKSGQISLGNSGGKPLGVSRQRSQPTNRKSRKK